MTNCRYVELTNVAVTIVVHKSGARDAPALARASATGESPRLGAGKANCAITADVQDGPELGRLLAMQVPPPSPLKDAALLLLVATSRLGRLCHFSPPPQRASLDRMFDGSVRSEQVSDGMFF